MPSCRFPFRENSRSCRGCCRGDDQAIPYRGVTGHSRGGNGFEVTARRFPDAGRREMAGGNLASNGLRMSYLRKVARAVRRPVLPFNSRFSPFGSRVFPVCHRQSSLMLKEYRLTHRGILVADAAVASRFNRMNDPVSKREAVPE